MRIIGVDSILVFTPAQKPKITYTHGMRNQYEYFGHTTPSSNTHPLWNIAGASWACSGGGGGPESTRAFPKGV